MPPRYKPNYSLRQMFMDRGIPMTPRQGRYGISGSAVVPGSEQEFDRLAGTRDLYNVGRDQIVSRQQALQPDPRYQVQVGKPYRGAQYEMDVGNITGGIPDPNIITADDITVVSMQPGKRRKGQRWMQNKQIVQTVLAGLKAKGAVDAKGNPVRGRRKGLTRRERALYNRMRIMGRVKKGVGDAMQTVTDIMER